VAWPEPGAQAQQASPLSISGASQTVRPLRNPLVLLDQDVEKTASRSFTLGTDVLFATGQDTLSPASAAALTALAARITDQRLTGKASVIGNTDDVGSPPSNLSLSQRRASAVTTRLTELLSGREITLTAVGKGETDPLVPNSSDANRARNRRVSVVFSGTQKVVADPYDIAVPSSQPAVASAAGAPDGSLAGTERTLTLGTDRVTWRVRLDVTSVTAAGPDLLAIGTQVRVLSGPVSKTFTNYRALFTGNTAFTDKHSTVIYDQASGQSLPVVIDGAGTKLESDHTTFIESGDVATDWQLFPRPKNLSGGTIALYVPAFGVLTVPAKV
jgi:outer membrane protein OmpA-like peptidoglycan-associated protein